MKGMKMIGKVNGWEAAKVFIDQIPYQCATQTGSSETCTTHFYAKTGLYSYVELAAVVEHFSTDTYNLYLRK